MRCLALLFSSSLLSSFLFSLIHSFFFLFILFKNSSNFLKLFKLFFIFINYFCVTLQICVLRVYTGVLKNQKMALDLWMHKKLYADMWMLEIEVRSSTTSESDLATESSLKFLTWCFYLWEILYHYFFQYFICLFCFAGVILFHFLLNSS